MKKIKLLATALIVACMALIPSASASAQSLLGDALGNMLQGVFSTSNLTTLDICGQWTSEGSAVNFQSDNFLKKAGGSAAAGIIENKIDPYFQKLGFDNAVLTIEADSTFTLKGKKFNLNGTITSNGDGTFYFTFKALGKISLGKIKTYVQKSGDSMDVMFDASKLKNLLSGISKISGVKLASTVSSVLDSYDGLCIGFKMKKTGDVNMPEGVDSSTSSGLGGLLEGVLGKKPSNSSSSQPNESTTTTPTPSSSSSESNSGNSSSSSSNSNDKYTTIGGALMNVLKSGSGK